MDHEHIQSIYSLNSSIPPIFLDDQSVCYVDRSAVVIHDLNREIRLRNIPLAAGEDVIGLMVNDEGVLAVASTNKITTYTLNCNEASRPDSEFECNVQNCTSACFGRFNGLMVALESSSSSLSTLENTSNVDHDTFVTISLCVWDTNEKKLWNKIELGMFEKAVNNTSFLVALPTDSVPSSTLVVLGRKIFSVNLGADSSCSTLSDVQLPYSTEDDFVKSYCWVDRDEQNLALLGTKCGDVIVIEQEGHFRVNSVMNKIVSSESIEALAKTNLGFVLGTASGDICLFSFLNDDVVEARCVKRWSVDSSKLGLESPSITGVAVSPSQDKMCIMIAGINQLHNVLLCPDDHVVIEMLDAGGKNVMPSIPLSVSSSCIAQGHGGNITSMDVCIGLPLVITSGSDQLVCIWNYETNKPCVSKYFLEPILSIAMHSSGLHAILGFHDNLRIMNIVHEDLITVYEIPMKMCRECRITNGGHFFAAVQGAVISVYDFYSVTKIADFIGHSGKVQNISWTQDGSALISCGDDGAVYQWDFESGFAGTRVCDISLKINPVSCIVGNEGTAWILKDQGRSLVHVKLPDLVLKEIEYSDDVTLGPLVALSRQGLNAVLMGHVKGDHMGSIRAQIGDEFQDFQCSNMPVTKLRLSPDNARLFVSDACGKVSVLLTSFFGDKVSSVALSPTRRPQILSNAILINKTELVEYDSNIEEMKGKLRELELQNQYQMRVKQKNDEEEARDAIEHFVQCLEQDESKYALLREERADMRTDFEEQVKRITDEQQSSYHEKERFHQSKIVEKIEAYKQALHEIEASKEVRTAQRKLLLATHEDYLKELEDGMTGRVEEAIQERIRLENESRILHAEVTLMNEQVEDDIDTQIELLKMRYEQLLASEKEATIRYISDIGIMKKKSAVLEKSIEDKKEEIQASLEVEEGLQKEIHLLHGEIELLEKELLRQEANLEKKNVILQNAMDKSQELNTYKFVLDSKIEDLAKLVEPRKAEVRDLKAKVCDIDGAIKVYDDSNRELAKNIDQIKQNIIKTQEKMIRRRKQSSCQDSSLHRINSEIYEIAQLIQHPERLKTKIFELQSYINKTVHPTIVASEEEKVPLESNTFAAQREEMLRDLQDIAAKNKMRANENRKVRNDLIDANMKLLHEISDLRSAGKIETCSIQNHGRNRVQELLRELDHYLVQG